MLQVLQIERKETLKIACVSDCHGLLDWADLPKVDALIIAGDYCPNFVRGPNDGIYQKAWLEKEFIPFLEVLPYKKIFIVAGNHDWVHLSQRINFPANTTYLQDAELVYEGFKFYGSPWQPWFYDWAFNFSQKDYVKEATAIWSKIPSDTDVLITHGPAYGILDECEDGRRVGCSILAQRIKDVKPKLHVAGHIHHSNGVLEQGGTTHINASLCNEEYEPVQSIWTYDLEN